MMGCEEGGKSQVPGWAPPGPGAVPVSWGPSAAPAKVKVESLKLRPLWGIQVNVLLATEGKLRRVVKKLDVGGVHCEFDRDLVREREVYASLKSHFEDRWL